LARISICDSNLDFCQYFDFWQKFIFLTKKHLFLVVISIFYWNFNCWLGLEFWILTKISIFDQNFYFWPKFCSFAQNLYFWPKLLFLTKISNFTKLFEGNFYFDQNVEYYFIFCRKFRFCSRFRLKFQLGAKTYRKGSYFKIPYLYDFMFYLCIWQIS